MTGGFTSARRRGDRSYSQHETARALQQYISCHCPNTTDNIKREDAFKAYVIAQDLEHELEVCDFPARNDAEHLQQEFEIKEPNTRAMSHVVRIPQRMQ